MFEVRRRAHAVPRKAGFPPGIFLADALSYATMLCSHRRWGSYGVSDIATSNERTRGLVTSKKELWWSRIQILVVKVVVKSDSAGV